MGLIRRDIETLEDSPIVEVWRSGFTIPDVIGMWAGEPDVPTPAFICEAASQAMFAGRTFYCHNRGIDPLRGALVEYHRRLYGIELPESRITLTSSWSTILDLPPHAARRGRSRLTAGDYSGSGHGGREIITVRSKTPVPSCRAEPSPRAFRM